MMKKIIFASGVIALMAGLSACQHTDIYPEEFDGVFCIKDAGTKEVTVYSTDATYAVPFVVLKGGYDPEHVSNASLKVMDAEEFDAYKETSGNTAYVAIGRECYSFSQDLTEDTYQVDYLFDNADERYRTTDLYIRPGALRAWLNDNAADLVGLTPVIPVSLVSDVDSVSAYSNMSIIMPSVVMPQLTADVSGVQGRTINRNNLTDGENWYTVDANLSIPCSNPWGFTVNLSWDPDYVKVYNEEHSTRYFKLAENKFKYEDKVYFAPGVTSMPIKLQIDLNGLTSASTLNKNYVVPLRIDPNFVWDDEENNPGDALASIMEEQSVLMFAVRMVDAMELAKIELNDQCVTSNDCEPTEGSINGLFDGNTATFFHSGWSVANPREETYGSYLEITLPEPMSAFRFNMTTRATNATTGWAKTVYFYGTNDLDSWPTEPFAIVENMTEQLNGNAVTGEFGTDDEPFSAPDDYKYIRFCVMESSGGSLGAPSTSVFWYASELELFGNYVP